VSAEVITDDTLDWLAETDEPFFCWTHYMDVHHPCFPPEKHRNRHHVGNVDQSEVSRLYSLALDDLDSISEDEFDKLASLYAAAVDYVNEQIGRIIKDLKSSGRFNDTVIIITSDHGELAGEHGQFGKPARMYDELTHVPLVIVNGPEQITSATTELVSLLDVPPLIHSSLGLSVPEVYEGQLLGIDQPREYVLAEHEVNGDVIVGARSEEWLYEADEIRGEHRLFRLRDGNFTQVPVSDSENTVVREAVLERLRGLNIEARDLKEEVEGDVQSRLEDLGYL
jgi:arylsulfatase A-like enzyme